MKNPWTKISSKVIAENPWWKYVQDEITRPDGSSGTYNFIDTPGSVSIVAITENNEVVLQDQFRYITGKPSREIPGGGMDDVDPLEDAKRELQEETGITASKWTNLGSIDPLNGLARETMYIFLAQNLDLHQIKPEAGEAISAVHIVPFSEVLKQIKTGTIDDGPTIAAIMKAGLNMGLFD